MYFIIYEFSQASPRPPNKSRDLTWLFSDSEIAQELGPEMVARSWKPNYIDNRRECALMILERGSHKELKSAFTGIFIRFLFYYNIITLL